MSDVSSWPQSGRCDSARLSFAVPSPPSTDSEGLQLGMGTGLQSCCDPRASWLLHLWGDTSLDPVRKDFPELPKSSYCLAPVELRVLLPGSTEHEHQRTEEEGSEDERQTYQSYRNSCYILQSLHPILSCFKMHAISTNYLAVNV